MSVKTTTTIENGGVLAVLDSSKGIYLPGVALDLPAVSEKDKADLSFAVKQEVEIIFASLIRDSAAVDKFRTILGVMGSGINIIAQN